MLAGAMRGAGLTLCGVVSTGCLLVNPAYDSSGEASGGATAGTSASGSGGATTGGTTAGGTGGATKGGTGGGTTGGASGDVSTGAVASTGGTTSMPDLGGPQYPYYPVTSCLELQDHLDELGQMAASGLFTLDDIGAGGATIDVYCEMDLAGGGWTLVGRSAGVDQLTSFGWSSARGDVADDGQAYSLDLVAHPIAFTSILLGDYASGKQWGGAAYQFEVGAGYVETYANTLKMLGPPQTILGGCTPWATWMFQHGGATGVDQAFFFRDLAVMDNAYFGLLANGFYLHTYMGCEWTGNLNHTHGMIMVR